MRIRKFLCHLSLEALFIPHFHTALLCSIVGFKTREILTSSHLPSPFPYIQQHPKNVLAEEIGCEVCTSSWNARLVLVGDPCKAESPPHKGGAPTSSLTLQISRALLLFHFFRGNWRYGTCIEEAASANECPPRTLSIFYLSPSHTGEFLQPFTRIWFTYLESAVTYSRKGVLAIYVIF